MIEVVIPPNSERTTLTVDSIPMPSVGSFSGVVVRVTWDSVAAQQLMCEITGPGGEYLRPVSDYAPSGTVIEIPCQDPDYMPRFFTAPWPAELLLWTDSGTNALANHTATVSIAGVQTESGYPNYPFFWFGEQPVLSDWVDIATIKVVDWVTWNKLHPPGGTPGS
jgi:hypothetical protein